MRRASAGSRRVVVYQPGFFDGEFFGYADFVEPSASGWVVADAKLARSAKPKAMLQVASYADQLARAGLPVPPRGALLLGDGRREVVPLHDVLPVFRARRERLRAIIAERLAAGRALDWGDDSHTICGYCPECVDAIAGHDDLLLVAGLRRDQRRKLREAGIRTLHELAAATDCSAELSATTFATLRTQAVAQVGQLESGIVGFTRADRSAGEPPVTLPAPSAGDIFFDFEGDPLYTEDAAQPRWGLEYLFRLGRRPTATFRPFWAHDFAAGAAGARASSSRIVAERRARVARTCTSTTTRAYETHAPAPPRRAGTGSARTSVDQLLARRGASSTSTRGAARGRASRSRSYSIKKLEPLYMGKSSARATCRTGDDSIAEYHRCRATARRRATTECRGRHVSTSSRSTTRYDCVSTLRLRDWLLDAAEVPVGPPVGPEGDAAEQPEPPSRWSESA